MANEKNLVDSNFVANSIFATVFKTNQKFGLNYIASILVGSKVKKILDHQHELLKSYGALKQYSFEQIRVWIKELIAQGYLEQIRNNEFLILKLSDKSKAVSAGLEKVILSTPNPELAHKEIVPGESVKKTLELFKVGKSVAQIAEERKLAQSTVLSHLAQAFQDGEEFDINQFVDVKRQSVIAEVFKTQGLDYLSPVKQTLGPSYSWEELKWVKAKLIRQQTIA